MEWQFRWNELKARVKAPRKLSAWGKLPFKLPAEFQNVAEIEVEACLVPPLVRSFSGDPTGKSDDRLARIIRIMINLLIISQ